MLLEQLNNGLLSREFTGRQDIIDNIHQSLSEGDSFFVLKGSHGAGKTGLIKKIAAALKKKQYSFIVTEGKTYPELLLNKIALKAEKKGLIPPEPGTPSAANPQAPGEDTSDKPQAVRDNILWLTENFLVKEKIMLVFDDFEENLDNDGKFRIQRLKELLVFLKDSLKDRDAFMFFTTGTDIPGFDSTWLTPFCEEEFKKLVSQMPGLKRLNGKSREKLFFEMGSSPRTLRLLDYIALAEFGEKKFEWEGLKKRIPKLAERILYKENEAADFSSLLLEKILGDLDESQVQLLKGLSIYTGAVGKGALDAIGVKSVLRKKLINASLLEYCEKKDLYRVHRLTARFMLGKMGEGELRALHLKAAEYLLSSTASPTNAKGDVGDVGERDLDGEIDGLRHYMEAGEWDKAAETSLELDMRLTTGGFPQFAFDLLEELDSEHLNRDNQVRLFQRLNLFNMLFGQTEGIISRSGTLIELYREMGKLKEMAFCMQQLGTAYEGTRKYDEALTNYSGALEVFQQEGDNEAAAFNRLQMGQILQKRGKYDEAMDHFLKARESYREAGKNKGEIESLQRLGRGYEELGRFDEALEAHQQSQGLREKIGDTAGLASGKHQIGNIFFMKNNLDEALTYYKDSLELSEKNGDLNGVAYSLGQIGMIAQRNGNEQEALGHYKRSLELFEEIGDKKGQASAMHQLGRLSQNGGDLDEALVSYKKSVEIREEMSDMPGMAIGYGQLGMLYFDREEYEESLTASVKSFVIFSKMNAPGAQLARKNMLRVRDKVSPEKFQEILKEFNINTESEESATESA
ncbi:MAG: tetratricopeptide repeat protein [bacterium]|nr:tetratricopeptide repeat protein [bacterium]